MLDKYYRYTHTISHNLLNIKHNGLYVDKTIEKNNNVKDISQQYEPRYVFTWSNHLQFEDLNHLCYDWLKSWLLYYIPIEKIPCSIFGTLLKSLMTIYFDIYAMPAFENIHVGSIGIVYYDGFSLLVIFVIT